MKISASLYSNNTHEFLSMMQDLDRFNIDYIHIDCNDDLSVFEDIVKVKEVTHKPIDLHVISEAPERFYDKIIETKAEIVCFQCEQLKRPLNVPKEIKSKLGLAITTETPIKVFEEYKDRFNFMLFMATTPGKSGEFFKKENFEKIREFKRTYPNKLIHVDGGVNNEVSFILRNMGTHCLVVGSYLFKKVSIGNAVLNLKSELSERHYSIKDFMMSYYELPTIDIDSIDLLSVLKAINDYKMGFVIIIDSNQNLKGIITDGNIRRSLIKNIDNLRSIDDVNEIVNSDPFCINENASIDELIQLISKRQTPTTFLPVITAENKLVGAISFSNLIKGEF